MTTLAETRSPVRKSSRSDQFAARRALWVWSSLARVRSCGHHGVMPDGNVAIKVSVTSDGSKAGFAGLATCGSTWACPVCAQKIACRRAVDLAKAVAAWHVLGGRVLMVTLTMRHRRGQALADLWDALSFAWGRVTSGRGWVRDQALFGTVIPRIVKTGARKGQTVQETRIGFARVVETTHGKNGWHVHVHALLFVRGDVAVESLPSLADSMFSRWLPALVTKGLTAPALAHGVDVRLVGVGDALLLGDYFSKSVYTADKAGWELAGGANKKAGNGNRTPFQILADVVAGGDADDLAIWWEWEKGSHNRKQLTWSAGLRELLALDAELTDEEIIEDDLGGDVVVTVSAEQWAGIRDMAETVLDLFEDLPMPLACAYLSDLLRDAGLDPVLVSS